LILAPWFDEEDRAAVLDDLDTLAARVRDRHGRLRAGVWYLWHAARYPVHDLWSRRGGSSDGRGWVERWSTDVRYALRRLRRTWLASAVVVATLAIGVAASTSVFSVLNVLVLGPLPFEAPEELVRIRETFVVDGAAPREVAMSPRRYELVRDRVESIEDVSAVRYRTFTLTGDGQAERVIGLRATWNHFTVLGVQPELGRAYGPDDDAAGAPAAVAVISHSLWRRRFGADPDVVGSELEVNGTPHTVVGVMPPGFRYPYAGELWLPMGIDPTDADAYRDRGLNVTARVAGGSDLTRLDEDLVRVAAELASEDAELDGGLGFAWTTVEEEVLEGVPEKVVALLWAAALVLLIGGSNIASMILARLHGERGELDLQVALGAGRGDLVRRFAAEGMLLTGLGLALGLLVSSETVGLLTELSPVSDLGPYFQDFGVDLSVAAFGVFVAAAAMLLATAPTLLRLLRGGYGTSTRSRALGERRGRFGGSFLDTLVAGEVALAVGLLASAGVLVLTLVQQWSSDLGIEADELYTFGVSPTPSGYVLPEERTAYLETVVDRVAAVPGVAAVGLTSLNPMRTQGWGFALWPDDRPVTGELDYYAVNHRSVTGGYFEAAGTRLLRGRTFGPGDGAAAADVAILSRGAAELLWPGQDPIGRTLRAGRASSDAELVTVVGVVEDVQELDFLSETWYRPYAQDPRDYNTEVVEIFVRSGQEAASIVPAVRDAIRGVDPGVPVFRVEPMADLLQFERRVESFSALLLTIFAAIGIGLAGVGIYGVLSYSAGRRTAEFGIRVALGARKADVLRDVTARAVRSCAVGLGGGLLLAVLFSRFFQAVVPAAPAFRIDVFLGAGLVALMVGAAAALGPALRALRIEPRTALNGE
jgi:predicted permease